MRPALCLLAGLLAGCATTSDSSRGGEPVRHLGPVTGIAVSDPNANGRQADHGWTMRPFSCSQAGVLQEEQGTADGPDTRKLSPPRWRRFSRLGFRVFDVAVPEQDRPSHVVVGGGAPGQMGQVACIDESGQPHAQRQIGRDVVYSVSVHPNGRLAAAGLATGEVFLLQLPRLTTLRRVHSHTAPCRDVCFSPDGTKLASAGRDGLVLVSPVESGPSTILQDHTAGVECVFFTHDSRRVVSGALDGKIRIHEAGQLRRTYQKLGAAVLSLSRGHGGQAARWFAGLEDGRVLEVDQKTASTQERWRFESAVFALGRMGRTMLVGLQGRVAAVSLLDNRNRPGETPVLDPDNRP